ncbi:ABC transporter permease subunit [Geoglobus acetivorans]|uniref:Branched-chain amino acid ABC transporter permease n=1 Tax=Geoglobus acetivorans TaxID=565033 RepID=A0ABZ3H253_GEOAI|nr:branched-chain amino acid ABC transporter permease [Geoglobus acetivorans]
MIDILLRILVYGAVVSGIWALVASGFSLIFGVSRILNFAHGTFFILSAYIGISLYKYGLDPYIASFVAVFLVGMIGVALYTGILARIKEHEVMIIIVTLAFALLVEQILILLFGEHGISYPSLITGVLRIGSVPITYKRILAFFVAIICLILLEVFINKTRTGKKVSASSQNVEGAMLVGIDVDRIFMLTMFISAVLAGIGGILYTQVFAATPMVALKSLIYAFAIVILGGLGSVRGSIVAAFIVGYVITIVITFFGARWSEFVTLLLIIAILVFRPTGLFGVEE